jgi:site-specific DNA recombinase
VAKRGAPFTVATLRNLLHNPLLGGRIRAGASVVEAAHDAILDEPIWEALQAAMARPEMARPRHRRVKTTALLAHLVRCGRCGASMSSHWAGKANGRRHHAYVCQSIIRKGASACPGSRVPAPPFEAFVVGQVRAVGRDPEVLREAVAAADSVLATERKEHAGKVSRLKADAERLAAEQTRLVAAVAQSGDAVPELLERLDALRPEVEAATAALRQAKADLAAVKRQTIDEVELRQAIASFDAVWEHLFPAERQRILALLIERVTVTASPDGEDIAISYSAEGARTLLAETRRTEP